MEEEGQPQPPAKKQSALDILHDLDKQVAELIEQHKNNPSNEDVVCANWARSEIQSARSSALATKSIFTHCFIAPWSTASPFRCIYAVLMLFLAIVIQVVVPFIILITRQPIIDLPNGCPNQSSPQTKIIGFALSLYFVFQTLQLCLNKLRGLGFLHSFVDLGFGRSIFIKLGILSQFLGMAGAGGAQYMLFIGNADGAFIVLVLQSLAMTFCLTVDQNLMGHKNGTYTAARVSAVSKDHLLCGGVGIGEDGGSIPKQGFDGIKQMILGENFILAMISSTGLAWVIALTYCIPMPVMNPNRNEFIESRDTYPMFVEYFLEKRHTPELDNRQCSAIYKYVGAMPMLVLNVFLGKDKRKGGARRNEREYVIRSKR